MHMICVLPPPPHQKFRLSLCTTVQYTLTYCMEFYYKDLQVIQRYTSNLCNYITTTSFKKLFNTYLKEAKTRANLEIPKPIVLKLPSW